MEQIRQHVPICPYPQLLLFIPPPNRFTPFPVRHAQHFRRSRVRASLVMDVSLQIAHMSSLLYALYVIFDLQAHVPDLIRTYPGLFHLQNPGNAIHGVTSFQDFFCRR
jgi:hypothetical protein